MARPPRIEYPGAFYRVTSRGNEMNETFRDTEGYSVQRTFSGFTKMNVRIICFTCLITISLAVLPGCEMLNDCEKKEILRLESPDKKVEAVLVRIACAGATIPYDFRVSIVPLGKQPRGSDTVFLAEKLEGESIQWLAPKVLEIKYKKARIINFRNYWYSKDIQNYEYIVEVREQNIGEIGHTFELPGGT